MKVFHLLLCIAVYKSNKFIQNQYQAVQQIVGGIGFLFYNPFQIDNIFLYIHVKLNKGDRKIIIHINIIISRSN